MFVLQIVTDGKSTSSLSTYDSLVLVGRMMNLVVQLIIW